MSKFSKLNLILITFFSFIITSKAVSCSYEEQAKLNNEAANVKVNYEIKERILDKSEYSPPDGAEDDYVAKSDYMQVNILNLTENMYVEVSNNYNDDVKIYNYADTDNGNISFDWYTIGSVVKYTVKVFSSSNTSCEGNNLKTLHITLPRYNDYSTYDICSSVPEYYLCERYVTYDEVSYDKFFTRVNKEVEKQRKIEEEENKKWYIKVLDYVKEHKTAFIAGGIILVVAAGSTAVIIVRKRRRSII